MLEIIKILLEIAAKLFSGLDRARSERFNELGQKLFLIYFRANEVIDTAHDLIGDMMQYRQTTEWRMAHGKKEIYTATTHYFNAAPILETQYINLGRLASAISNFAFEFKLVSPGLQRRLMPLIHAKSSAVGALSRLLKSGKIPLDEPSRAEIEAEIERSEDFPEFYDMLRRGEKTIEDRYGSERHYNLICEYLDSGEPQRRLAELERLVDEMRSVIEQHWTLKDLLPGMRCVRASKEG